ncbi:HNH endonuclease [Falseniella ignava]|uniref:HNH endonuclease n=1 Tax=Falseniella ignava TaxID=137730 RepID=A0A2I1K1Z8_9LACT|nr:HNH endonuclease signature motif containing protein [Falseniella ignava]PKY89684.1 HNH endonuclease [Falseniella ignava]
MVIIPLVLTIYILYRLIRYIRKERYFKSEHFLEQKQKVSNMVREYNEISEYVKTMPREHDFVADNTQFSNSHLAKFENKSKYNMKRDKNKKSLHDKHVHQASLQVVRRASEEPIKYLCKYFNIGANENNLNTLQELSENIYRLNNAIDNLNKRQRKIEDDFNPPKFIRKHYRDELMKRLEVDIPDLNVEYVDYVFEYVSAGGNSSQTTTITLDEPVIEETMKYISDRIKYKKSAKAQRSLMTKKFREKIKQRDRYTCQNCKVSTKDQDLLLLEVDHIIPVSKGGLSTEDNLQTLCWKCNRTKSDKIL